MGVVYENAETQERKGLNLRKKFAILNTSYCETKYRMEVL